MSGRVATIITVDFNCVRKGSDRHETSEGGGVDVTSRLLNELVNDFKFKDAAAVVEGEHTAHTYFSDKGTVSSRIDFMFVSEFVEVKGYELATVLFSDHKLLCCRLELGVGVKFGSGLWKLNVAVLEDEEVCKKSCT